MPVLDRKDILQEATIPTDPLQRPRFGAMTEVVKDAFVAELRRHFSTANAKLRVGELVRIDKYAVSVDPSVDPLETAVSIVRSYPDIAENLPTIAILSAAGRNLKLDLGDKFISYVIPPAQILTAIGPFNIPVDSTLTVRTYPDDVGNHVDSTYIFRNYMFSNIAAATSHEVAAAINAQALYVTASIAPDGSVRIAAGRSRRARNFPNSIEIIGGTALAALGLTAGDSNTNTGAPNVMYSRYYMAADLTITMEVLAESENIRTELSDLLYDFLSFNMADRKWQLYGRSTFDTSILDEWYQIILKDGEINFAGESDMPRPGDQRDKIYVNRITIPVTAILYTDRIVVGEDGQPMVPTAMPDLQFREDLPPAN